MIALKQVMVATDFEEAAEAAFAYGRQMARSFGATLHVVHVADDIAGRAASLAGFAEYVADYHALLGHFEERLPKPWIALGHSMGGCLTLLALAHGEWRRFEAAVLSAPMLGLQTGGRPKRAARALAWVMARAGRGSDYILGDPGDPYGSDFDNNIITHDKRRYLRHRAQVEANRELALGSGTWGWLDFAFSASAWLKRDPRVTEIGIPVLALGAAEEKLVDNADQRQIIAPEPPPRLLPRCPPPDRRLGSDRPRRRSDELSCLGHCNPCSR